MISKEYLQKNTFLLPDCALALGIIPTEKKVLATTSISVSKLQQIVTTLYDLECLNPVIQITDDGLVIFKQTTDNRVGIILAPCGVKV